MADHRDRHRRDPLTREAARDEERVREHLAAVAVPEHRERPALPAAADPPASRRRRARDGRRQPPGGARASAPRRSGARASGTRVTSTSRSRRRRPRPAAARRGEGPRPGIRSGAVSAPDAAPAADGSAAGPTWRRRTRRDRLARGNHARPPASGAVMSAGAGGRRSRASRACSRNAETLPVVKTEATATRSARMPRRSSARRSRPKAARCSGARGGPPPDRTATDAPRSPPTARRAGRPSREDRASPRARSGSPARGGSRDARRG